jgi:ParB family transcriptional regulator, chromosome partitioning protein
VLRLAPTEKKKGGLASELDAAIEATKHVPWTAIANLRGDAEIMKKIDDAEALLKSPRKTLSS